MTKYGKRRVRVLNNNDDCCCSWLLFVFVVVVFVVVAGKCDQVEYDLIHSILSDYDSSIRPSVHHNYTLNVTFGLSLTQLIDIDERNMIVTTNCWLTQNWIDPKLTWDPDQFNHIKSVHIPAERIWKPDILLVNNADSWAKTSSISTNAIVNHDGNVTWLSTVIFKSSCSINVRYFPFDEQQCDMIFASWTFDGYLIDIGVNSNEGDVTNYIKNGEWHLVKLQATKILKKYSCCDEPYPEIYYKLIIRRRPLFYVFNMVFPCMLITLVAFLGFYLPPGSTEKVSIGITTLLSITVFLMLVAESMPPTSEQLPLLGIYYAVTIGIVSFSTALAVITLNVANKGVKGRKVPRLVKLVFFEYLAKIMCIELTSTTKRKQQQRHAREEEAAVAAANKLMMPPQQKQQQQSPIDMSIPQPHHNHDHNLNPLNNQYPYQYVPLANLSPPNVDDSHSPDEPTTHFHHYRHHHHHHRSNYNHHNHHHHHHKSSHHHHHNHNQHSHHHSRHQQPSSYYPYYYQAAPSPATPTDWSELLTNPYFIEFKKRDLSPVMYAASPYMSTSNPNIQQLLLKSSEAKTATSSSSATAAATSASKEQTNEQPLLVGQSRNSQQQQGSSPRPSSITAATTTSRNNPRNVSSGGTTRNRRRSNGGGGEGGCAKDEGVMLELDRVLSRQFGPLVYALSQTIESGEKRLRERRSIEIIQDEWSDVAMISDHILCYFFCLLTLVSCFLIFFNSPHVLAEW